MTNPLKIPEINTWSFEHLWLGNFWICLDVPGGKLGWMDLNGEDGMNGSYFAYLKMGYIWGEITY